MLIARVGHERRHIICQLLDAVPVVVPSETKEPQNHTLTMSTFFPYLVSPRLLLSPSPPLHPSPSASSV